MVAVVLSDFSVKLWPRPSWELLTQYDNSSVLVQIWIGTKNMQKIFDVKYKMAVINCVYSPLGKKY